METALWFLVAIVGGVALAIWVVVGLIELGLL